ncbi:MAG: polymerase [Burkholderiales bacterium PBB3]|nr:MAG: polymerase [Burkholderiales bacterium PBB3]
MQRIQALGALFVTYAWLAYDHYEPWVNFHSEALAFFGLGLFAIAECLRTQPCPNWTTPRAPFTLVGFVITFVWLQLLVGTGIFFGDALLISLYLCGLAVAITLGLRYASIGVPDTNLKSVFVPLVVAALLSAAIGLLQWLNLEGVLGMYAVESSVGDRPMGNLGQPNQLATLLLMGLVSLAWSHDRGHGGRWVFGIGAGFLTLVLALTQSRAGMLGAVSASIFLAWKAHTIPSRLSPWHFLVWLLGYGLALFLVPAIYDLLHMHGGRSAASLYVASDRYAIWGQALAAIWQSPWIGYGWPQTPAAQAVGSLTVPGASIFTFSHNIVLDMLLWNGIPMGLLIVGLCAWWFLSRLYSATQTHAVFAMAALLPLLVHSMVEYPFAYSYFLLTAGLLVGVVEAMHRSAAVTALSRKWVTLGLGVWFCIGSVMVYEYFQVDADYRFARLVNQGLEQAPANFQPPSIHLLTQLSALSAAMRIQPAPNMPPAELEIMRTVLYRFVNREVHFNYIIALGLNGNATEAIRQLSILRSMYGNRSFKLAQFVLRNWQKKYPELALVQLPS